MEFEDTGIHFLGAKNKEGGNYLLCVFYVAGTLSCFTNKKSQIFTNLTSLLVVMGGI